MDLSNTTLQNLILSRKKAQEDAENLYRNLGSRIFQAEDAKYKDASSDLPESYAGWKTLMRGREEAASLVFSIKDNLKRVQELGKADKDLSKSLAEAKKKLRAAGVHCAVVLWPQYTPERFPSFAPVFAAAEEEKKECGKLEERQRAVNEGLEAGKPLGRMMAQFRGAGIAAQLYYRRSRFEQCAGEAMEALVSAGAVGKLGQEIAASGTEELAQAFTPFSEAAQTVQSFAGRLEKSEAERRSVSDALEAGGAGENPARRLDELRAQIKEKDAALDNLCRARGMDHCALFFDAAGNPLPGAPDMESDAHGTLLAGAASLLAEIHSLDHKIDVTQTELKIAALEKTIARYGEEIDDLRRKTESLQEQIAKRESAIGDAASEKAGLETYLEKITAEAGGTENGGAE